MKMNESVGINPANDVTVSAGLSFEDTYNQPMKGHVTMIGHGFDADGNYLDGEILSQHNLILNGAREIMRDVMAQGDNIYKVVFGDLGLNDTATTSELVNVPAPLEGDTALVRVVGEKLITAGNISTTGVGSTDGTTNRPGIKYTITLEKADLVPQGLDKQFILEMALSTQSGKLFSRITHPVIIKTTSLQITLIWELLF